MNDEQCMAIIAAIKDLTDAIHIVGDNIDNIGFYSDREVVKKLQLIAEVLEYGLEK